MQSLSSHITTWVKNLVTSHFHAIHDYCTHNNPFTVLKLNTLMRFSIKLWAKAVTIGNRLFWSLGFSNVALLPLLNNEQIYFFSFSLTDIQAELHDIKAKVTRLSEKLEAKRAYEELDFLTTRQFAALVNKKPKTISNKASSGEFADLAKFENGQWLIHKSLVEHYGN